MRVLKLARSPAPCIEATATIREAVAAMAESNSGALVVLDNDSVAGIVSERDVVLRAVGQGLDPETTLVSKIMSSPVESVPASTPTARAVDMMTRHRFRHLAVMGDDGKLAGLVSSRDAFQEHLSYLLDQLLSLESFVCADGPGG
jgi:CBS domain-containing protein